MASPDLEACLAPSPVIDADHPAVVEFAGRAAGDAADPVERAVRLYYAVRDGIRYDPYSIALSEAGLRASGTLARGSGWCVAKAVLLAACCRAQGLPARLGFADVRNHLSTERMRQHMQTDVFYWHGYTAVHVDGRWVKATPAFNVELCAKFDLRPLAFDGRSDSLFHPFDLEGHRHMEYVAERGEFDDVPIEDIAATFRAHYPGAAGGAADADFAADVERETARR